MSQKKTEPVVVDRQPWGLSVSSSVKGIRSATALYRATMSDGSTSFVRGTSIFNVESVSGQPDPTSRPDLEPVLEAAFPLFRALAYACHEVDGMLRPTAEDRKQYPLKVRGRKKIPTYESRSARLRRAPFKQVLALVSKHYTYRNGTPLLSEEVHARRSRDAIEAMILTFEVSQGWIRAPVK